MFEFNEKKPIYLQIVDDLLLKICSNDLSLGEKLPSVRELAVEYTVNPNTIQKVIQELQNNEIIVIERGKGTYITSYHSQVNKIKEKIIASEVNQFLSKLMRIGFLEDEIIDIVKNHIEKGVRDA